MSLCKPSALFLLSALALLPATSAVAQVENSENTWKLADGASSPPATIEDVAWLSGYWRGSGFGGECEEAWGEGSGDRMLGWFSLRQGEDLTFSEAVALVETGGSLEMWVKHFNPDFSGWEEKDDYVRFPLVKLGEQAAYFSGLTYRRDGDRLKIYVVVSNGGEKKEHLLEMRRVAW